jgi:hypothetical protein
MYWLEFEFRIFHLLTLICEIISLNTNLLLNIYLKIIDIFAPTNCFKITHHFHFYLFNRNIYYVKNTIGTRESLEYKKVPEVHPANTDTCKKHTQLYKKVPQKLNTRNPPPQEDPRTHSRKRQWPATKKDRHMRPLINETSWRSNSTPR